MILTASAIDILEDSLQGIAWKLVCVMIVASILGMLFKTVENKLLSWAKQKARERKERKKQHDQWTGDWVNDANARQQNRYEYTDPVKQPRYTYNERARMWVDEDQMEEERHRQAYKENRKRWQAYEEAEAQKEEARQRAIKEDQRMQSILNQQRNIVLTPEEQELAKQIRIERNGPTYEEWKAEKLRQQQEQKEHPEK